MDYVFPVKRRRISEDSENKKKCDQQKNYICELPSEVLQCILSYLNYSEITKKRQVCRHFRAAGESILNNTFTKLQKSMMKRFQCLRAKMPRRESLRRKHPLMRECDIIETVHMRLSLLQMQFGRHIEMKNMSFFPGQCIDEVYRILRHIKETTDLQRAFRVTDELFDLTTMAIEYFKENIEPSLPLVQYSFTEYSFDRSLPSGFDFLNSPETSQLKEENLDASTLVVTPKLPDKHCNHCKKTKKIQQQLNRTKLDTIILKRELRTYKSKLFRQEKSLAQYKTRLEIQEKSSNDMLNKINFLIQKNKTEQSDTGT